MFFKVIVLCLGVTLMAGDGHSLKHHRHREPERIYINEYDYDINPKFDFEYKDEVLHTGDHKLQQGYRNGGSFRHEYHGDHDSGLHADVKHSPHHTVHQNCHHY